MSGEVNLNSGSIPDSMKPRLKLKVTKSGSKSKKSSNGVTVTVQPYGLPLFVTTNPEEFQEIYTRLTGEANEHLSGSLGLAVVLKSTDDGGDCFMMLLPEKSDEEVTWHECLHMTHFFMQYCGILVDSSMASSESQAYLQGHIVELVIEAVYPKPKRAPRRKPNKT